MTDRVNMDVLIEIRPRLKVANVVVVGVIQNRDNCVVSVSGNRLIISGLVIDCKNVNFKENKFSLNPPEDGDGFSFRLELKDGINTTSGNNLKLLTKPSLFSRLDLKVAAPHIKLNTNYRLCCSGCQTDFASFSPGRVLPLPSSNWRQQTENWYCCVNKLTAPPPMLIQPNDILYGPGVCVVHANVFQIATDSSGIDDKSLSRRLIQCSKCGRHIGRFVEHSAELWSYAVMLQEVAVKDDENAIKSAKPFSDDIGASAFDNFRMALLSAVDDSGHIMPRLAFTAVEEEATENRRLLLVWVVDKQLQIFTAASINSSNCRTVVKVMFRDMEVTASSSADKGVPAGYTEVVASSDMLSSARHSLAQVCDKFPHGTKFVNDFQVSYVDYFS